MLEYPAFAGLILGHFLLHKQNKSAKAALLFSGIVFVVALAAIYTVATTPGLDRQETQRNNDTEAAYQKRLIDDKANAFDGIDHQLYEISGQAASEWSVNDKSVNLLYSGVEASEVETVLYETKVTADFKPPNCDKVRNNRTQNCHKIYTSKNGAQVYLDTAYSVWRYKLYSILIGNTLVSITAQDPKFDDQKIINLSDQLTPISHDALMKYKFGGKY